MRHAGSTRMLDDLLLPAHHRHLEAMFDEVRALVRGDDPRAFCLAWARFDRELEAHFRAEERHLFPAFAVDHPDEARGLAEEHQTIRRLLQELGIDVELHQIRAEVADRLVERLRDHAKREDALLYSWASSHLRRGLSLRPTLAALERMRDELRLKMHLGSMELRERFEQVSQEVDALAQRGNAGLRSSGSALLAKLRSVSESLGDSTD